MAVGQLIDNSVFADLVAMIEEAPLKPELWQKVCESISAALRGATITVGIMSGAIFTDLGIATAESDTREPIQQCQPVYQQAMRPFGHAVTVNLQRPGEYMVPFGVIRLASASRLTEAESGFVRRLAPHFDRSLRVFVRLKEMEAKAAAAHEIVDCLPQGVIVTDATCRIGSLNYAAQFILDEADGLLMRHGMLSASSPVETTELSRLIQEVAGNGPNSGLHPHGAMQVTRPSQRRPLPLLVTSLPSGSFPLAHRLAVQINVRDLDFLPEMPAAVLCRFYRLTSREAEVAALLRQGRAPNEVGNQLAMTMNTVRTHIRHLLLKTGTERLTGLISILNRSPSA